MSSRGTKRSRLSLLSPRATLLSSRATLLSSRAERGFMSSRGTKRSRLSLLSPRTTLLSSRGTWRSRLSRAGRQIKARLLRRLSCHRERSAMCPLGMAISPFSCKQTKKRDCFVPRNDKLILSLRAKRGNLAFLKIINREKRHWCLPRIILRVQVP